MANGQPEEAPRFELPEQLQDLTVRARRDRPQQPHVVWPPAVAEFLAEAYGILNERKEESR